MELLSISPVQTGDPIVDLGGPLAVLAGFVGAVKRLLRWNSNRAVALALGASALFALATTLVVYFNIVEVILETFLRWVSTFLYITGLHKVASYSLADRQEKGET